MHVLVTCKYKKDRIKSNREKVETPFSPLYVNGSSCCHGHQRFDPICLKTLCSLSPPPVILHIQLASEIFKFESVKFSSFNGNFDDDSIKNERASMETAFSQYKSMGHFFRRMSSLPASKKGSDQKQPRKGGDIVFPIISQWGISVSNLLQNLMQPPPTQ